MPFLVLSGKDLMRPADARLDALAARLCPYGESPRLLAAARDTQVWGTSLVRVDGRRLTNALEGGTASFRVTLEEGGRIMLETDELGTCPLWFGALDPARPASGVTWVAGPEAKAIAALRPVALLPDAELQATGPRRPEWSPYRDLRRLTPGAALVLDAGRAEESGVARSFEVTAGASEAGKPVSTELAPWAEALGRSLLESAPRFRAEQSHPHPQARRRGPAAGAFVSGGIDSSIACALGVRAGPVRGFSLASRYGNELADAHSLTSSLECTCEDVTLTDERVPAELERVVFQNEIFDGLTAEILIQFSALYGAAAGSCARILTGYGSDLLFDGMLRHAAYMEAVGLRTTPELIARTRWTGELAPFVHWSRGLSALHVFWDSRVIDTALSVPRELCFVDGVEKHVLREAAVRSGLLARSQAFRKKRGLSDGTGVNRLFSDLLGEPEAHAYSAKSDACVSLLRNLL